MTELAKIQQMMHAPKGKRNEFGNFDYRSAEDIIAAAKPILKEMDQALVMTDWIELIGDRYYVKATATIIPCNVSVCAYAREADTKKGMDVAQITGSASSYARKYALAGLFALDNNQDPDAADNREQTEPKKTPAKTQEPLHIDVDKLFGQGEHAAGLGIKMLETWWQSLDTSERKAIGDDGKQALKEMAK